MRHIYIFKQFKQTCPSNTVVQFPVLWYFSADNVTYQTLYANRLVWLRNTLCKQTCLTAKHFMQTLYNTVSCVNRLTWSWIWYSVLHVNISKDVYILYHRLRWRDKHYHDMITRRKMVWPITRYRYHDYAYLLLSCVTIIPLAFRSQKKIHIFSEPTVGRLELAVISSFLCGHK